MTMMMMVGDAGDDGIAQHERRGGVVASGEERPTDRPTDGAAERRTAVDMTDRRTDKPVRGGSGGGSIGHMD